MEFCTLSMEFCGRRTVMYLYTAAVCCLLGVGVLALLWVTVQYVLYDLCTRKYNGVKVCEPVPRTWWYLWPVALGKLACTVRKTAHAAKFNRVRYSQNSPFFSNPLSTPRCMRCVRNVPYLWSLNSGRRRELAKVTAK